MDNVELLKAMMDRTVVYWEHRSFHIIWIGVDELKYVNKIGAGYIPARYFPELHSEIKESAWDEMPTDFCGQMTCEYDIWLKKYESDLKQIPRRE